MINLDWNIILTKCPMAWSIILGNLQIVTNQSLKIKILKNGLLTCNDTPFFFSSDMLYSLFDKEGVILNVYPKSEYVWSYTINKIGPEGVQSVKIFNSRVTATHAAFINAFSYLEQYFNLEGIIN